MLALDGDIYPFFDLANISLLNKAHEDLQRTLCVYTVGKCLVLDRNSTTYAREWNTQLLMTGSHKFLKNPLASAGGFLKLDFQRGG